MRKTNRYKLAEAIAGAEVDSNDWKLPWSTCPTPAAVDGNTAHGQGHLLTIFCGVCCCRKRSRRYDAFDRFPRDLRQRHFIRRTKEEMLHFDGQAPVPAAKLRHAELQSLGRSQEGEQELYDETTEYIRDYYNRAGVLESFRRAFGDECLPAASRQLHLCPHAFLRAPHRANLEGLIDDTSGADGTHRGTTRQSASVETRQVLDDLFNTSTADEKTEDDEHEDYENAAL